MEYCKFIRNQDDLYQYGGSSSTSITILTGFLMEDYRYGSKFFKKWALELNDPSPEHGKTRAGNCTYLEYKNDTIFIDHEFQIANDPILDSKLGLETNGKRLYCVFLRKFTF